MLEQDTCKVITDKDIEDKLDGYIGLRLDEIFIGRWFHLEMLEDCEDSDDGSQVWFLGLGNDIQIYINIKDNLIVSVSLNSQKETSVQIA